MVFITGILCSIIDAICGFFSSGDKTADLLMTDEDRREEFLEKVNEMKKVRDERYRELRKDPSNPMTQYTRRYINNVEEYKNDPDNEKVLEWYKKWNNGLISDPELKWAPKIYTGKNINPNFLSYLELQDKIIKNGERGLFIRTIQQYYPEINPNSIKGDIENIRCILKKRNLKKELYNDLISRGMTKIIAKELVNEKPEDIKSAVIFCKYCLELGYTDSVVLTLWEIRVSPDSEFAKNANILMTQRYIPGRAIVALFKGDLDEKGFATVCSRIESIITEESLGLSWAYMATEFNEAPVDRIIDSEIEKSKRRKNKKNAEELIEEKKW
jgi:hypothetical protein